jgi:hypothetical protein
LGVTLDEKLNFGQHILNIEKKAGNSLGMLREIKGLGQIKTKFHLQTCIFVKQFFQTNL